MKILEYNKYKGDPYWFKAKKDGVSGEQRLPEQRRFKKGGKRFKKGEEVLFWPKGKKREREQSNPIVRPIPAY